MIRVIHLKDNIKIIDYMLAARMFG